MSTTFAKPIREKQQTLISWEAFQRTYLTLEDAFKYEWLNGIVEESPYTMKAKQIFIQANLLKLFRTAFFQKKVYGALLGGIDLFFGKHHRRPDMCWFTNEQINNLADDKDEIPAFLIEIIPYENMKNYMLKKMEDYRSAKVQVVWHIFPEQEQVHIYGGPKLKKMEICMGKDVCSASPALPSFQVAAEDIFKEMEE